MTLPCVSITTAEAMQTGVAARGSGTMLLTLYAAAHFVVDVCCAAVVFNKCVTQDVSPEVFAALLLLYHVIGFGLQSVLGLLVDATNAPRAAAVAGGLVSAIALLIPSPIAAVVVTSFGNALFHVGGGAICLRATPRRATASGFFVAPGAMGLLLGTILGKSGVAVALPLLSAAVTVCLLMACTPVSEARGIEIVRRQSAVEPLLALVLLSVVVRSVLGFWVLFSWETQPVALLALTAATVLGKAVGGIVADRCGWMRTAVGSLLAALPFLVCGQAFPIGAIPGVFFLNMTMPITLAAVAETLPGRPGFAFGLTTLALLVGEIPFFLGGAIGSPVFVLLLVLLSLAGLYNGLRLLAVSPSFPQTARA
jgi:MFS transporter, FSR family, fosmidomycin resistance protein